MFQLQNQIELLTTEKATVESHAATIEAQITATSASIANATATAKAAYEAYGLSPTDTRPTIQAKTATAEAHNTATAEAQATITAAAKKTATPTATSVAQAEEPSSKACGSAIILLGIGICFVAIRSKA